MLLILPIPFAKRWIVFAIAPKPMITTFARADAKRTYFDWTWLILYNEHNEVFDLGDGRVLKASYTADDEEDDHDHDACQEKVKST